MATTLHLMQQQAPEEVQKILSQGKIKEINNFQYVTI